MVMTMIIVIVMTEEEEDGNFADNANYGNGENGRDDGDGCI